MANRSRATFTETTETRQLRHLLNSKTLPQPTHQKHYVTCCDASGTIALVSLFIFPIPSTSPSSPSTTQDQLPVHSSLMLHTHGTSPLRDCALHTGPNTPSFSIAYLNSLNQSGLVATPLGYNSASNIVRTALVRMADGGKTMSKTDVELGLVLALYTLPLDDAHRPVSMPRGIRPASMGELWVLLNRPEYCFWTLDEAAENVFGSDCWDIEVTRDVLDTLVEHVAGDEVWRRRIEGMVEFMVLWHVLKGERLEASWIKWCLERMRWSKALGDYETRTTTNRVDEVLESVVHDTDASSQQQEKLEFMRNPIVQFMANKGFNLRIPGVSRIYEENQNISTDNVFDKALANYVAIKRDWQENASRLPVGMIFRDPCYDLDGSVENDDMSEVPRSQFDDMTLVSLISYLRSSSLRTCVVCISESSGGGGTTSLASSTESLPAFGDFGTENQFQQPRVKELKLCSKCKSVAYCSREHQAIHWRQGHKLECAVELPDYEEELNNKEVD